MHVIEADHQPARAREPLEQAAQRAMHDIALNRRRRRAARVGEHGQRHGERIELVAGQPSQPSRVECLQVRVDRVEPEAVGRVALELRRAPAEHQTVLTFRSRGSSPSSRVLPIPGSPASSRNVA